jgi:hypothetical protein
VSAADNYGTHHSKINIAFYPTGVRVCVMTGNMCETDVEHKHNAAVVLDFPLLGDGGEGAGTGTGAQERDKDNNMDGDGDNDFGPYLREYLQATARNVG